ncbi:hypothetical protein EJD97_009982, partial [Solanum chilense]
NKDSICWKSVKTRLGRRTSRWIVVVTTDRYGLRRPILVQFLLLISSLPSMASMTDRHRYNGPSRVFVPKKLILLESGYWDYFSELHHEPAAWTVIDTTDRHGLRNPTLGQSSLSFFSRCTMLPHTDRHKRVGPSQAP